MSWSDMLYRTVALFGPQDHPVFALLALLILVSGGVAITFSANYGAGKVVSFVKSKVTRGAPPRLP